jgi:hypothetical protein
LLDVGLDSSSGNPSAGNFASVEIPISAMDRRRKMVRPVLGVLAALVSVSAPVSALAGTLVCGGTVVTLSYHANGQFMIRLSDMNVPVFFCTPDSTWSLPAAAGVSTPPEACKAMYATFLAARLSGTPVNNMYFDGDVPASCNAWPAWTSANIRHYLF